MARSFASAMPARKGCRAMDAQLPELANAAGNLDGDRACNDRTVERGLDE
jgi:hypothetical protein